MRAGTRFCPGCGHNLLEPAVAVALAPASGPIVEATGGRRFLEHWEELKRLAWLFGLLLGLSFVFGIVWRSAQTPWLYVAETAAQAVIVLVMVVRRWPKLAFLFKPHPTSLKDVAIILGIAVLFVVLANGYFELLERAGVPITSSAGSLGESGWPLWTVFLLVSVMPGIFEELAFRGVIQSSLERMLNARDAWLIQAALFSILHLSPLIFPSHFLMGLCFGYIRRRSRSIYPGMLLHAFWNAFVVAGELLSPA